MDPYLANRPKLSDPARERLRLQSERDGRVRFSACSAASCESEALDNLTDNRQCAPHNVGLAVCSPNRGGTNHENAACADLPVVHQNSTVWPIGLSALGQKNSVAQTCERQPLRRGVVGNELLRNIGRHLQMKLERVQ
jgi:hypothetical protein